MLAAPPLESWMTRIDETRAHSAERQQSGPPNERRYLAAKPRLGLLLALGPDRPRYGLGCRGGRMDIHCLWLKEPMAVPGLGC